MSTPRDPLRRARRTRPIATGLTAALTAGVLGLSGCLMSSVRPAEVAIYGLEPVAAAAAEPATAFPWQLVVEAPQTAEPLAGNRIALRDRDRAYGVLQGIRWAQRAPELVQTLLVRTFEDSGRLQGVARAGSGVRRDYALLGELRAFEADYGAAPIPTVRVVLSVKLVRAGRQEVIGARVFMEQQRAGGERGREVVAAFQDAAARLLPRVQGWVIRLADSDWQARRPHGAARVEGSGR